MIARWPRPDFLAEAAHRRPAWVAWWAAGAVLVGATTASDTWSTLRDLQDQRARLALATQRAERGSTDRPARAATSPAAGRSDTDALRAAERVTRRLSQPWGRIVTDVEAETPPGLQWLVFDRDAQNPQVRLEGTAPDLATILRVVDDLSTRAGWSEVALAQLQPPNGQANAALGASWHFELRAAIDPAVTGGR